MSKDPNFLRKESGVTLREKTHFAHGYRVQQS